MRICILISVPKNDLSIINTEGSKSSSVLISNNELSIILKKLKRMSQEPIINPFLIWDYQTEKWVGINWIRTWFRSVGDAYDKVCSGLYDF